MPTALQQRFTALPAPHAADALELVTGSLPDYAALAEHHYRARRPATATRVLVLRDRRPTVAGRFLQRRNETQTAAVLVESLPTLNCQLRDWALHDRYGSWLAPKARARLLTQELRCISRVVVEPRWRGLGLAVRLVRHALDTSTTIYTEALAAMGKVHPFFEKAGMTAHRRPPHAFDARLVAALSVAGFTPLDLGMLERTMRRIASLDTAQRDWLLHELHRWYRQNGGGRAGKDSPDPAVHLRLAQQRLLLEPVYYLHDNRTQGDGHADR